MKKKKKKNEKKVGGSSSAHAKFRSTSNQTFSLTKFLLRIANNSFNRLIETKDEKAKFLLRIANDSFNEVNVFTQTLHWFPF
jgi:hypothetical protein